MPRSVHLSDSYDSSDEEGPPRPSPELDHSKSNGSFLAFLLVCFQSLGGIYGDIGTSPLYTYSSIFKSEPSQKDILGATSCIFYSFTIVVIIKYCFFVFYFGSNQHQGGAVAVYAKIARKLNLAPRGVTVPNWDPKHDEDDTDVLQLKLTETRASFIEKHSDNAAADYIRRYASWIPLALTFCSTGLIMADGLLTPTTSVLSAVAGIAVPAPDVANRVVLISCLILVVLFLGQRYGSSLISTVFGPVIFLWMISLLAVGIYNITSHPGIFRAFSPKFAIDFLKEKGIDGMGAVILPITGTETMFADLGHYSVSSVTVTMIFFVYPCLIMAYFGQAARLSVNPSLYSNAFYQTIPGSGPTGTSGGGLYWVIFVLATLATIIASQAVILGVSSMYMQLEHLDCVPKLHTVHTSKAAVGKIYIPFVNYVLMILVVLTTIGFQTSDRVTNAYGLCIAMTFFFTTCLIAIVMKTCYNVNIFLCLLFLAAFGTLDMCFTVAGLRKIQYGAWFPLMVSIIAVGFMVLWRWGRSIQIDQEWKTRTPLNNIMTVGPTAIKGPVLDLGGKTFYKSEISGETESLQEGDQLYLNGSIENLKVARLPGILVFHANAYYTANSPNTVPELFSKFVHSFPAVHERIVFLAVRVTNAPFVQPENRLVLSPMNASAEGFYRALVRFGFMDSVVFDEEFAQTLREKIDAADAAIHRGRERASRSSGGHHAHRQSTTSSHYKQSGATHIFGYETLVGALASETDAPLKKCVYWVRDCLLNYIYTPIDTACRTQQNEGYIIDDSHSQQGVFTISQRRKV